MISTRIGDGIEDAASEFVALDSDDQFSALVLLSWR